MDALIENMKAFSRYYTGYPRLPFISHVYEFKSEREFIELLHEGDPVVVAFTITCEHSKHLDYILKLASSKWHPQIRFMRVECPKHISFCISRQRQDFPFVEVFQSSKMMNIEGESVHGQSKFTRYTVGVTPYNYDLSLYGFREFFKKHGIAMEKK